MLTATPLPLFVTSEKNPLLKKIRRAVSRGGLTDDGLCLAESPNLVREALRIGADIVTLIFSDSARDKPGNSDLNAVSIPSVTVSDQLFDTIAATEHSQGLLALVRPIEWTWNEIWQHNNAADAPLIVILDGIQDPGNAGAIVRSADGFSVAAIVSLKGSVSLYNPKAIRASAGSIFRLPMIQSIEEDSLRQQLSRRNVQLVVASPRASIAIDRIDLRRPTAIVIGSEGAGVRPSLEASALPARIPTERIESLNASIAAAILLYEAKRQRTL